MQTVFDDILSKGIRSGQVPARTKQARDWYRNVAKNAAQKPDMEDESRIKGTVEPGSMYLFHYDPKWKETLPFYDRFPLIFPIEQAPGGFIGINLHYLPHRQRAILMDELYKYANNKRYDDSTKLQINYKVLKQVSKLRYFKPCIKRYLTSHVQSPFLYVYPSEWDVALFLDCAQFTKKSQQQVWEDSLRKLK